MESDWKPNLFIPGFPKCGTSALCEYLAQHKDIYVIPIKEPNTLATSLPLSKLSRTQLQGKDRIWTVLPYEEYERLYKENARKKYRVDASQPFSAIDLSVNVARYIREFSPNAKIVLMIREQKNRLISYYLFSKGLGLHDYDFSTWLNRITPHINDFLFYEKTSRFYDEFGSNLLVLQQKALMENPQQVMDRICDFLGVERIAVKYVTSNESLYINSRIANKILSRFEYASHVFAKRLEHMQYGSRLIYSVLSPLHRRWRSLLSAVSNPEDKQQVYRELLEKMPSSLKTVLEEDYNRTVLYCKERGILLEVLNTKSKDTN
ncbi:MAG: sulfotransferase [Candidatus Nitrosocaldus sp.]|nr:sulfotransferase [Candidatus Nitrosocaldus sp.]